MGDEAVNLVYGDELGVTLKDVAREAGTSVASVSAALHGSRGDTIRVGEQTKLRIREIARNLGYVTNPIAKSLATGKTRTLGLMLPYVEAFVDENPFCSQVTHGVLEEMVRRHYNLVLYTGALGLGDSQISRLIDSRVDGVLLVLPDERSEIFERCKFQGIPCVSVMRRREFGGWSVNVDDYEGGRLAARHLLEIGRRRVLHLSGTEDVPTSEPRLRGFQDEMARAGVHEYWIEPAGFGGSQGYDAMKRFLARSEEPMANAVFAANDLCAEGAMRAIRSEGLSVPEDFAVVGFDDTWYARMTQPPLTSIRAPISDMGARAARMLIDRLEGLEVSETQPILSVDLSIRESTIGGSKGSPRLETTKSPTYVQ